MGSRNVFVGNGDNNDDSDVRCGTRLGVTLGAESLPGGVLSNSGGDKIDKATSSLHVRARAGV